MIPKKALLEWLADLPDDVHIAVRPDGRQLRAITPDGYLTNQKLKVGQIKNNQCDSLAGVRIDTELPPRPPLNTVSQSSQLLYAAQAPAKHTVKVLYETIEPEVILPPGYMLKLEMIETKEIADLITEHKGVSVYCTWNDENTSEYWFSTAGPGYSSDGQDAFDIRELPDPPGGQQDDATKLRYAIDMGILTPDGVDESAMVKCKFCDNNTALKTAHRHGEDFVGATCCWEEHLRTTA